MIPAPHGRCFKSKIKRPAFNYPASFRTIFSSHTESADFVRPGRPSFLAGLSLFFRCCIGQLRFLCRSFSSMRQALCCLNCFRIIRNISLFLRQQVFSAVRRLKSDRFRLKNVLPKFSSRKKEAESHRFRLPHIYMREQPLFVIVLFLDFS